MIDLTEEFFVSRDFAEKYCQGKVWPLPRLTDHKPVEGKYEVVVAGAGPAGLLLRLLLARHGLGDESVLCVDVKERPTEVGHADGINARTMEMFGTLGLEREIIRDALEVVSEAQYTKTDAGWMKQFQRPVDYGPARFGQFHCFHQGRFERILLDDLRKYSKQCVRYSSGVTSVAIDEADQEYPVSVSIQSGGQTHSVRCKYVVGADGAHSAVRRSSNIEMIGDAVDEIWGVIDFVPETNFPDARKFTRLSYETGQMAAMIIPRERMSDGNWLIRIYIGMVAETVKREAIVGDEARKDIRQKKADIKKDHILAKVQEVFAPNYDVRPKPGTNPVWWTTYNVGQRIAEKFNVQDSEGHPRILLVGDACHTHSPRQGQGMNISMQDAYYLSWRLAYVLLGLTKDVTGLLQTYESERRAWAQRVVSSDKRWNQEGYTWEQMINEIRAQITGCGLEEKPNLLVSDRNDAVCWQDKDLLSGVLRTGRRLFNIPMLRWADGKPIDIHDEFVSDGRYRILVLASKDFPQGRSRVASEQICALTQLFPDGMVDAIYVQPHDLESNFSWEDMPAKLKSHAEMKLHYANEASYARYCVDPEVGAIALVRPDGIVCITVNLEEVNVIKELLMRVLVLTRSTNGKSG